MANAVVKYAESLGVTAATTAWVDTASLADTEFEANKTYLILAHIITQSNSSVAESRMRLVHGTTPTVFDDASCAYEGKTSQQTAFEMMYLYFYTQPATPELVKLQISNSATSTTEAVLAQILALKLSDDFVSGTDYHLNEVLANYTMTTTPTAQAITASFTPNGTDKWLFIGHMIHDVVSIVDEIGFELYDSVAGVLNMSQIEGEDATNDLRAQSLYWVGVPTNASRTLTVRPFNEAGSNVALATRVFALNLSKFAQVTSTFDAAEVDPPTQPTYGNLATISPTPSVTGNWVYLAFSTQDINEEGTTNWETRLQVNPDGGGLVSDPAYDPTSCPGLDGWDSLDEVPHSVFKLRQLNSGAARDINWQCRQNAGTTGRMEDNGLVAFSVALAVSTTPITGRDAGAASSVGSLLGAGTLAGRDAGAGTGAGTLAGAGALLGICGASASAIGGLGAPISIEGHTAGAAIGVASLLGQGTLAGQDFGEASGLASLLGAVDLNGVVFGEASGFASLLGAGSLSGQIFGEATGFGNLSGAAPAGETFGVSSGYAFTFGALLATGQLIGITAGESSAFLSPFILIPPVPPAIVSGDAAIIFTAAARGQVRTLTPREWWRLVLGRDLPEEFAPPAVVEYDETLDLLLML
jgi:hypothetical protein